MLHACSNPLYNRQNASTVRQLPRERRLSGLLPSLAALFSTQKVQVGGALLFHVASKPPVPCEAKTFGATYANPDDKALYVCNCKDWAAVYLTIPGSK